MALESILNAQRQRLADTEENSNQFGKTAATSFVTSLFAGLQQKRKDEKDAAQKAIDVEKSRADNILKILALRTDDKNLETIGTLDTGNPVLDNAWNDVTKILPERAKKLPTPLEQANLAYKQGELIEQQRKTQESKTKQEQDKINEYGDIVADEAKKAKANFDKTIAAYNKLREEYNTKNSEFKEPERKKAYNELMDLYNTIPILKEQHTKAETALNEFKQQRKNQLLGIKPPPQSKAKNDIGDASSFLKKYSR